MASTGFGNIGSSGTSTTSGGWFEGWQAPEIDMESALPLFNTENFSLTNMKQAMEASMPKKIMGMNYQQRFQVFGGLLLISALFFVLAFAVGLPMIAMRPQKFALSFVRRYIHNADDIVVVVNTATMAPFSHSMFSHLSPSHTDLWVLDLYGKLWHSQRPYGTPPGHVRPRSTALYRNLPRFHVHDSLLYLSIRRHYGLRPGYSVQWHATRGFGVVFGVLLARWYHGVAVPGGHAGTFAQTRPGRVRPVSSRLSGTMLCLVDAGVINRTVHFSKFRCDSFALRYRIVME